MRVMFGLLVLVLAGCSESAPEQRVKAPAPIDLPTVGSTEVKAVSLMPVPDDPAAVARLEQLGYTVHQEEAHLHPPGVKECPAMAGGPVM